MHKVWSSIEEMPYCFQGHLLNFKVTRDKKIVDFETNWTFPGCNYSLISLVAREWYTKFEAAFESNLSKITRPVAAIKSLRFALFSFRTLNLDLLWISSPNFSNTLLVCMGRSLIDIQWCHFQNGCLMTISNLFVISLSNFMRTLFVSMNRSVMLFRATTFKMTV